MSKNSPKCFGVAKFSDEKKGCLIEFIFSGFQGRWRWLDIVRKDGKLGNMKATLDIPDDLYKRVKVRSALEGKPIRSVAIELFQRWIQTPTDVEDKNESVSLSAEDYKKYPWLELARQYMNGNQSSDFAEIKKSIAMGWAKETALGREASNE